MIELNWSFEQALHCSQAMKKTLLLGSGFSADLDPRYLYSSLFDKADMLTPSIREIFARLGTKDFEEVIRTLSHASFICSTYGVDADFCQEADLVKRALVQTIGKVHHPDHNVITEAQANSCLEFLSCFDEVFTLNYDLLPYWVLMKTTHGKRAFMDGFGYKAGASERFLCDSVNESNFFYLHGALHLYKRGDAIGKLAFKSKDQPATLLSQIQENIKRDEYPLFVAEGTHGDKIKIIEENGYLTKALQRLKTTGRFKKTALFTYGVAFNPSDKHILENLADSGCTHFFVGLYGHASSDHNHQVMANVEGVLKSQRVVFLDSSKFSPWHKNRPMSQRIYVRQVGKNPSEGSSPGDHRTQGM